MTTAQDLEQMTTEERYTSAIPASSLKFEAHKQGQADVIAAAGMSRSRVGAALLRLHTEWDRAWNDRPGHLSQLGASEAALLMGRLKTLREVRVELTAQMTRWKVVDAIDKAPAVILWWLDQTCHSCNGTKLAASGRGSICKVCRGTGQSRLPMGEEGKRLANYMDDCVDVARNSIGNRLRNTMRR